MPNQNDPADQSQAERKLRGPDKKLRTKSRTLTVIEFEAIRPFLGISSERIEAARLAMVEGKKFAEVAEAFGWKSRQSVDRAVANVWAEFQKYKQSQEVVAQLTAESNKKTDKAAKKKAKDEQ
jgi:hypothetical protein